MLYGVLDLGPGLFEVALGLVSAAFGARRRLPVQARRSS